MEKWASKWVSQQCINIECPLRHVSGPVIPLLSLPSCTADAGPQIYTTFFTGMNSKRMK